MPTEDTAVIMLRIKDSDGREFWCSGKIEINENGIEAPVIATGGLDINAPDILADGLFSPPMCERVAVRISGVTFPLTVGS